MRDGNGPARLAGRGRLPTVRRDFFLDPAKRLTEQERALMTAMLRCLVGDVAAAVRAALPSGRAAANDEGDAALIQQLTGAGLLDEPELMALLLRRADEERIAMSARARSGRREARVLQGLVSHDYGAVAAAAMALILARGRRRDRFGQCLIAFDDLSAASADVLVHSVAAGLRREVAATRSLPGADLELAQAAEQVLGEWDEERGIDALTAALVHFLDELLSGEARHVMALLRAAAFSRDVAAGLLAGIGDLLGIDDAATAIDLFDGMGEAEVEAERSWLTTAPPYRAALDRLGQGRG